MERPMATATAPAPAPKITPTLATTLLAEEQYIKFRWAALQRATRQLDDRGLEFGMAMYEYRAKHSAQGQRTDLVPSGTKLETFEAFCDRMRIARRTAYNWIARYEESIGKRPPERPPEPSNRELRRVAFKAEHPELAKRSNKEVDNEIYKTGFPTESRRCGGAAHATKEIEKHPELHPLAVEGYKLFQTCLETARNTKRAR